MPSIEETTGGIPFVPLTTVAAFISIHLFVQKSSGLVFFREQKRHRAVCLCDNPEVVTGKSLADKAHISTSKTYNQQRDYRFDRKTFTELRNAQSITLAYDGLDPLPPMFCVLLSQALSMM